MTFRTRLHHLLEGDLPGDRASTVVRRSLYALILLNVAAVVFESVHRVAAAAPHLFAWFETVSVAIFTVEYLARLWTAPEERAGRWPRLRWITSPAALVDLVAVLPSFLPMLGLDLRSLRLLRLLRVLRVGKLGRYSVAVQTMLGVLKAKSADLLSLLVALLVMLVIASTVMYWLENEAQPNAFSSIPATMWWGIVTLTTIGYGDMAPVTTAGRTFGGVVAVLGIGMFALPAGLLGAAFVEELGKARAALQRQQGDARGGPGGTCPHCGKPLPGDG